MPRSCRHRRRPAPPRSAVGRLAGDGAARPLSCRRRAASGGSPGARPRSRMRARCKAPVRGGAHRHALNTPVGPGQPDSPVAAVDGRRRRPSRPSATAQARVEQLAASPAACPSRPGTPARRRPRTRPRGARRGRRRAAGSPRSRAAATVRARRRGPRRAGRRGRARRAAANVSRSAARGERRRLLRACTAGETGLDPPGNRCLGDHEQSRGHSLCSVPEPRFGSFGRAVTVRLLSCPARRGRSRAPSGDLRPARRAGGRRRRPRRSSSPRPPPAAPSPAASRSAGRAMPSASSALPRRGAHRAEVAQRDASCGAAARTRAPRWRRGRGPARRRGRRPAGAEHQVRVAAATGSATFGRSPRIERPVAVHEAHDRRSAPRTARRSTPRRTRARLDDDPAPSARRARPSRRWTRCRRRSACSRRASAPAPTGSRALVEHRAGSRRARGRTL